MIRVADYIAEFLASVGIRHVFLVTGGGAMHLNDAMGRCKGFQYVACHSEQTCAMAAESYARLTNRMAAVNVTTGPGGINTLNGVFGAYTDSIPMFVVSGQVKWETMVRSTGLPLRQLGDQEADIVAMASPVTKYAVVVQDPQSVRYHLEKAYHLALSGRPGPVWLDVPMNVQGAMVDPDTLVGFDPAELPETHLRGQELASVAQAIAERVRQAKRPVMLWGSGIGISGMRQEALELARRWGIPVVTGWNAHDVMHNEHPSYVGRQGSVGDRAGNFAVQNADLVLSLGSRLSIRQVSYNWEMFAPSAYKIMVDIDEAELQKPTLKLDMPVHADLRDLIPLLLQEEAHVHTQWLEWCQERRRKYPTVLPVYWEKPGPVNPYCFMDALFHSLDPGEVVVCGDGTACVVTFQAAYIKEGMRLYHNSGCASMGYDLPGTIGAAFGLQYLGKEQRIICLAGDGSIMMNIQELQTIKMHGIPVKLFVLYNRGYHSIRQTQHSYFPDNIVGCGEESGLSFPEFRKIADTFGFAYRRCETHADLKGAIEDTLNTPGAAMCEIVLDLEQQFSPKLTSRKLPDGTMVSSPLQDMAPFLSGEELASNMLI